MSMSVKSVLVKLYDGQNFIDCSMKNCLHEIKRKQKISCCPNISKIEFNRKIEERGKIHTPNTQIHDRSLSWLETGTSIKSCWIKLVLWA